MITSTALRDIGLSMAERAGLPMKKLAVCGTVQSWRQSTGQLRTQFGIWMNVGHNNGTINTGDHEHLDDTLAKLATEIAAWKESQPDATS